MARIRTIKPDFFRHEVLQDLEIANPGKYPMMVFAGLWGHCDSKGRFEWRPRQLKLDVLPFLPFDMAETLAILEGAGMVKCYTANGKEYGEIPTFEKHQRLSGKEASEGEKHPSPSWGATGKQQGSNREIQESQEGKGREEEGKEEWSGVAPDPESQPDAPPKASPTAKGTRLSANWKLPKPWGDWALAEKSSWSPDDVRKCAERFADHWRSVAGKAGVKLDWEATWRNWVRREPDAFRKAAPHAAQPADDLSRMMRTGI